MPLLQPNQGGSVPLASTSAAREDFADYIAIVDAKSTPFFSMSPKGKDIGNMQFSWLVDNYLAPAMGGVVDGTDVTVKKWYAQEDGMVRLEPANAAVEPLLLPADRVAVHGRVIALLRKY